MKKWLVGLMCAGLCVASSWGVDFTAGVAVIQDFNTIGTNTEATLPTGWRVDVNNAARTLGTYSAAGTSTTRSGSTNVSSTAANGVYNLGPSPTSTDRAIGWLSSGSATKTGNLYVELQNAGPVSATDFTITYNVVKYRNGSNSAGYQIQLYYSSDGTAWTAAGSDFLTAFSADADTGGFASPPGATRNVAATLTLPTAVDPQGKLYLAWSYSVSTGAATASAPLLGVDDISILAVGSGPATFSISLNPSSAFNVEQGEGATITATPFNAEGTVGYTWSGVDAAVGTGVGNVFTINTTAALGNYTVTCAASDGTSSDSKSVSFSVLEPSEDPDYLVTFETATLPGSSYAATTATLEDQAVWALERVMRGSTAGSDRMIGTNSARFAPVTTTNAVLSRTTAYADPISKISYWVGGYGSDDLSSVTLYVEVHDGSSAWVAVQTVAGDDITTTLTEHVIDDVAIQYPNATYLRFRMTGTSTSNNRRVNIDNIGVWLNASTDPYITYTGSTSGTVGEQMSLSFSLANATASSWEASLGSITSAGAWTWTPDAAGAPSLTVTAKDGSGIEITNKTVALSVTAPVQKYAITITPPVNGTVDTTPAAEAEEGQTVTINATPNTGYTVDTITVNAGAVTVTGSTFVMPASAVTVVVTFAEYEVPDLLITFDQNTSTSPSYTSTSFTSDNVVFDASRCYGGDANGSGKSMRVQYAGGTNGYFNNQTAFSEAITKISFEYMGYNGGANHTNITWWVQVSADKASWENLESFVTTASWVTFVSDSIPAGMFYFRITSDLTGTTARTLSVDNVGLWFGEPGPTISYTGSTSGTVGTQMTLNFSLANGTADGWTASFGSITSAGVWTWTPTVAGSPSLVITAKSGSDTVATKTVNLTVTGGSGVSIQYTGATSVDLGSSFSIQFTVVGSSVPTESWSISGLPNYEGYITDAGLFTWTPSAAGTYDLTAVAYADLFGDTEIARTTITLTVTGTTDVTADISSFTLSGGNLQLVVTTDPADANVNIVVQGATSVANSAWNFAPLMLGTDYTLSGKTVTILPNQANQTICVDVSTP